MYETLVGVHVYAPQNLDEQKIESKIESIKERIAYDYEHAELGSPLSNAPECPQLLLVLIRPNETPKTGYTLHCHAETSDGGVWVADAQFPADLLENTRGDPWPLFDQFPDLQSIA